MYQKILAMFLLIFLLYPSFSMSGDGNVPVEQKENVPDVVSQADQQPVSNPDSNENEIVKDRLGIDTGMTKKEFDEFKTQYFLKAEELGILNYPKVSPKSYFEHKVNLSAVNELKELDLFLTKDPFLPEEGFAYSITHSDIIVIGTIDSVEYFYNTEAEEWRNHTRSKYFVKVEEILKGNEYYETVPDILTYHSSNGRFLTSGEYKPIIEQKYMLFFQKRLLGSEKTENDLNKMTAATFRIEGNKIYRDISDKEYMKSYNEIISTINKFQSINRLNNFYKRQYSQEDKNEK